MNKFVQNGMPNFGWTDPTSQSGSPQDIVLNHPASRAFSYGTCICIVKINQNEMKEVLLTLWPRIVLSEGSETDLWPKFSGTFGIIESTPYLLTHFFRGVPKKVLCGEALP